MCLFRLNVFSFSLFLMVWNFKRSASVWIFLIHWALLIWKFRSLNSDNFTCITYFLYYPLYFSWFFSCETSIWLFEFLDWVFFCIDLYLLCLISVNKLLWSSVLHRNKHLVLPSLKRARALQGLAGLCRRGSSASCISHLPWTSSFSNGRCSRNVPVKTLAWKECMITSAYMFLAL